MDAIGSIASIAQLVSQVICLIQTVQQARDIVHGYNKLLNDQAHQLESLRRTLYFVKKERELQTSSVFQQIEIILKLVRELEEYLRKISLRARKSVVRRHVHALASGSQDVKELEAILCRLDRAQHDLGTRIQLAHVGLTRRFSDEWTAVVPVIQRVDQNVQSVLGSRLENYKALETSDYEKRESFYFNETEIGDIDVHAPDKPLMADLSYHGNRCFDQAWQINGDIGVEGWRVTAKAEYEDNEARGQSVQINGRVDLSTLVALLQSRK